MKIRHTLYIALLLLITSCGSAQPDKAPETFSPSSEKGLAIATITFEEDDVPVNDIYRFFYEAQSGDKKFKKHNAGKVVIHGRQDNKSGYNGDFNNKKSYLVVLERDPGSYAFTQYSYLDHLGPTGSVSSSKQFAIPFEIKKGQITYIGEFAYKDLAEKGTPRIYVADYYKRDIEEFKKKYPAIDWSTAVNATPAKGNNGGGIIDFRE